MASLIQDLELIEIITGDIVEFAAGKTVSRTEKIGANTFTISAQVLANGTTGTNFQVFNGSFLNIISLVFADYAALSAGMPVQVAEKLGNTWYGISVSVVA
jgi:hypothetical protein